MDENIFKKSRLIFISIVALALLVLCFGFEKTADPSVRESEEETIQEFQSFDQELVKSKESPNQILPDLDSGDVNNAQLDQSESAIPPLPKLFKEATMIKLAEEALPNDSIRIRTLYETGFKYPHLLVEETFDTSAKGEKIFIRRKIMVGNHMMVSFPKDMSLSDIETWASGYGYSVLRKLLTTDIYLIQAPEFDLDTLDRIRDDFNKSFPGASPESGVYIEADYMSFASALPNDPDLIETWGMHNSGQSGGTTDADIDAREAWDISTGSKDVIVVVVDSGIDRSHPDLAGNIWTNPNEIPGNGIDDDNNGFIDDVHGWDFAYNDNDPSDVDGHGTHCAGTIGAVGDNGVGVAGVCWNVSLVASRHLDDLGSGSMSDGIDATNYAAAIGADIASHSWGNSSFSNTFKQAIDNTGNAGVLHVAAAGNDNSNIDNIPEYPASFDSPSIIAVGGTDRNDGRYSDSNFGSIAVDLAAPGVSVYSTTMGGGYDAWNGTSMATPHVAGAAALIKGVDPNIGIADLKALLLDHVDPVPSWSGQSVTGGRLNVYASLQNAFRPNNAELISQNMPSSMLPGSTQEISITYKNIGEDTWSTGSGHKLRTENSPGNTIWTGSSRVYLDRDVVPGQEYTFSFQITAPISEGVVNLQFRMVDDSGDNIGAFGEYTENVAVIVSGSGTGPSISLGPVSASDDAEEQSDNTIAPTSSDLEFMTDGLNQTIAVRFSSVNIPDNATVTNAYIQFTGDSSSGAGNGNAMNITIRGHDINNSPSTNGNNGDITGRTTTSASINWSPPTWSSGATTAERTPNIASIVQEIVNRGGWNQGNPITFIFSGSGGLRRAESVDGDAGEEPKLYVDYTTVVENYLPAWSSAIIRRTVVSGSGALTDSLMGDVADDDTLTFSKLSYEGGPGTDWLTVSTSGNLSGKVPAYEGVFRWIISADDPSHSPVETILEIAVVSSGNNAPVINSIPPTGAVEDSSYEYSIYASDPDGDSLSFSVGSIPSWLSFNSSAIYLRGTPSASDVGTHNVIINIDDGTAVTAHSFNVEVFSTPQPFNHLVNGSFENGSTAWELGSNTTVSTAQSEHGSSSLRVAAGASNTRQVVGLQPNTDYELSVWILASGMTGGSIHFDTNDKFDDATGPFGPGGDCQFNINTGAAQSWTQYNGSFNSAGETSVTIRVYTSSMVGFAYVDNVRLSVLGSGSNSAPVITSDEIISVNYNETYSYQLTAADANADPLNYYGDTVPSWLNFNNNTGLLIGYPGLANVGDHVLSLRVSDGVLEDIQSFTITVMSPPNTAPSWGSSPVVKANAVIGEAYSESIATDASDVDGDTLQFSKITGNSWLSVSSTGSLTGTPSSGDLGLNTFTVTVTDGIADPVPVTLEITVDLPLDAFSLWVNSNSLPPGEDGASDDPDGDGIVNLLEFALNGDPNVPDSSQKPTVSENSSDFAFIFQREEENVTYTVERSVDLINWTDPITVDDSHGIVGGTATVLIQKAAMNNGKLFFRLKVDN